MTPVKAIPHSLAKAAYHQIIRWRVPRITPSVVRTIPHDSTAFTQGLTISAGRLFESTGVHEPQSSSLRELCLNTGRVLRQATIADDFAEGIACDGEEIVQLFWKTGIARVYSMNDFEPLRTYEYQGEGWGLTTCPGGFAMSSGRSDISIRNQQFELVQQLNISSNGLPLRRINDIEHFADRFLANVWFATDLFVISANSGTVTAVVDCGKIAAAELAAAGPEAVLNGIAYNSQTDTFVITGKLWKQMYEIKLPLTPLAALDGTVETQ